MPLLEPIQGVSRHGVAADVPGPGGYPLELHGAGHLGVGPLDRIVMLMRLGIDEEIEYALLTLTYYSCNDPKLLNLNTYPIMGTELIRYFYKPFPKLQENEDVLAEVLLLSAELLLLLRNAVQDLHNQQWLLQVGSFRRHAAAALSFLVLFVCRPSDQAVPYALLKHAETLREILLYLLDVLDPVCCFYVDTGKNDPLVAPLLTLLAHTTDKYHLLTVTKCLHHLLFVKDEPSGNCIDAIAPPHLEKIVNLLLLNDEEAVYVALGFVREYLHSPALNDSVAQLRLQRLKRLVLAGGGRNLHVLLRTLPELIVAKIPLVDPVQLEQPIPVNLCKRLAFSGVPSVTPTLPKKIYDIIIGFPEPLRATTWLRCCYEPYVLLAKPGDDNTDTVCGEVTQISLWKAYENQFMAIWKDRVNASWPNLLPAVDFIKNVNSAFPNSEAMVVNVPVKPGEAPKKRFIIKGIQPRRQAVSIETGNLEALRRVEPHKEAEGEDVEIGMVDYDAFELALRDYNQLILDAAETLPKPDDERAPWYSPTNKLATQVLTAVAAADDFGAVFRQYNEWLPALVYANPGLIEQGYINGKWIGHLL